MGKWVQASRGISMAVVIIGLLFRVLHWEGGGTILFVGLVLWVLYLGLSLIELIQKRKKMSVLAFIRQILGQLGISFLLFSFFLRFSQMPGQQVCLIIGITLGIFYGVLLFVGGGEEEDTSEEEALIDQIGKEDK